MSLRAKRHDRTERPVVCRLWIKPQTCDFHESLSLSFSLSLSLSYFVAVGSFTTDGGLLQPSGCVKITPHRTIFAMLNVYKEFAYKSEIE